MNDILPAVRTGNKILSADTPCVFLGSAFNADDGKSLSSLRVSCTQEYNNFGAVDRLKGDLSRFFEGIGNAADHAHTAAHLISTVVYTCAAGLDAETAWFTLRASKPTTQFDIPRWHSDGYYYAPYEGEPRKVVLTLKGPGTLFNLLPRPQRAAFVELENIPHENPDRNTLIANSLGSAHVIQALLQNPALYIVGADHAAVHSEPPIHEDRLFLSIVPGAAAQVAELRERWNMGITTYA